MNTPIGVIFVPRDTEIKDAEADNLIGLILSKIKNDNSLSRWYPILGIKQITDNSEEPVMGNLSGTGYTEKLRDGASIYLFEYPAKLCRSKVLDSFDQWDGGVYLISSDKKLWGRVNPNNALAPYLPETVSVYGGGFNDGQNIITSKLQINFGLQGAFIKKSAFFGFENDDDLDSIVGLQDVIITAVAANRFSLTTKCNRINLFDAYSTILNATTLWKVTKADGAAVSVSAVTANATTKDFTLTFTAPATKYYVSLANVSTLEAAGVVGYESVKLTINP
jgi:hypothetical protein